MNAQTKIEASCPAVYVAITEVMKRMAKEGIDKDRRNSQQGYNFRGIDDVYNSLCGVLAENKLMMLPTVVEKQREERQTQKGGVLNYTILTVDFKLVSSFDGSSDVVRMIGEAMDSADKSSNKAQSAAMKYAALQVFMIPTKGDNDADATTHDVAPRDANQRQDNRQSSDNQRAAARQNDGMPDEEWSRLAGLMKAAGVSPGGLLKKYKVENLRQLNHDQYLNAVDGLNGLLAKKAKEESDAKARAAGNSSDEVLDEDVPF